MSGAESNIRLSDAIVTNEMLAARINAYWRERGLEANARVRVCNTRISKDVGRYPEIVSGLTGREQDGGVW